MARMTVHGRPADAAAGEPTAPPTLNLLVDFADAADRLGRQLRALDGAEAVFDAFLLAAGLHQIAEDHLHRDLASLGRVARHLPELAGERAGRAGARAIEPVLAVALELRARRRSERAVIAWTRAFATIVHELASCVAGGAAPPAALGERATQLLAAAGTFPGSLRTSVIRLPHCFRSFDQRPDDARRLVGGLAARRRAPGVVVGVRTAGSYLAPLVAAELELRGSGRAQTLTLRPGQRWLAHERRALRSAAASGATVAIVDEPPRTGRLLVEAAEQIERTGVARRAIVLVAPLLGTMPPAPFAAYDTVPLPWPEWSVHERLRPAAVAEALSGLLPGHEVTGLEPRRAPEPRRGHLVATYRAGVVDRRTGAQTELEVCVEGAGAGYLGRHALAVARPLADFLPAIYGLRDGLLYRAWLADEARLRRPGPEAAARIAEYVHLRRRALAVPEDMSRRITGREPAWELAADMIGDAFGRARLPLRALTHATARRLLRTPQPSIVDGSMSPSHWFTAQDGALRKVDFHVRAFSNHDAASYDAVFDLAGAAREGLDDALRREYERLAGESVGDERWLLLRLVHQAIERRTAIAEDDAPRMLAAEQAMTRVYRDYVAGRLLAGVHAPAAGPLCALDVDWVLEVRWAGFPALSPAAALALRALARHGHRAVVVTGRSLADVRERCRAYGLAGGVAEYGGAVYDHAGGGAHSLLSDGERADLAALRAVLRDLPGVHLDPGYEHSVRAFRLERRRRRGLDAPTVAQAIAAAAPERLRTVAAQSQTDFVPGRIDKGVGLRALAQRLGGDVALAVGDGDADLPMLELAAWPAAPVNADAAVRRSAAAGRIRLARRPYGAGLLEVVAAFLGHHPRGCATCAPARAASADAALLLTALGALDGSGREKLRQAALLAVRLVALEAGLREPALRP